MLMYHHVNIQDVQENLRVRERSRTHTEKEVVTVSDSKYKLYLKEITINQRRN